MSEFLKRFFLKETSDWKFWLLLGFIAKFILFLCIILQPHNSSINGFWGSVGGDTNEYLLPIENFLKNGTYEPDFRMPGYGAIYLPFIFLLSKATALNILIIFQVLLSGISVYVLALIAKYIFKSDVFFYSVFYLYAISSFANLFDSFLLTESLTVSLLIFLVYFLIRYFDGYWKNFLFFSGLLLAWVIFLRPVFIGVGIFFYLVIVADSLRKKKKLSITLLFLLPFILLDGIWIVHNYNQHKQITPLSHLEPPERNKSYLVPAYNFVESWGGSIVWWDPTAEIRWFNIFWGGKNLPNQNQVSIPGNIYTSKFNKDSLETLRKMISRLNSDTSMPAALQANYYQFISEKFNIYAGSVKDEKPLLYYVKAPLKILKKFLIHSGTYNLINMPSNQFNIAEYLVYIFYSIFYIMTVALGLIGILLLFKDIFKVSAMAIIPFIPAYIIIVHPLILRYSESRFLVPAYPFMLICAVYPVYRLLKKNGKLKTY